MTNEQQMDKSLWQSLEQKSLHEIQIEAFLKGDKTYHCPHCKKKYIRSNGLVKHLQVVHNEDWNTESKENNSKKKLSDPFAPTLLKLLYLQYDTADAYRFGDGDRAMLNAKLEFLYLYAVKRTKYRLWLWRMLAYDMAVLSPRQSMEYRWNITVNTKGGLGRCIPNDNFVELQVKNIKQTMARQGPNKSFETAKTACRTTQVVSDIKDGLKMGYRRKGKHSKVDVTNDVVEIAQSLMQNGCVTNMNVIVSDFEDFVDPLSRISTLELHSWIKKQKAIARDYML